MTGKTELNKKKSETTIRNKMIEKHHHQQTLYSEKKRPNTPDINKQPEPTTENYSKINRLASKTR